VANDTVIVVGPDGSEVRDATPEEQAQIDYDRAHPTIRYVGIEGISARLRTTDATPTEALRFPTATKHVYRATLRMTAIDAGNGTTRDSEVRMVFKSLAAGLAQVGTTVVLSNAQDTAAASWRIQAAPDGTDLVITVTGAAGREIDWSVTGEIGAYAPEGVPS